MFTTTVNPSLLSSSLPSPSSSSASSPAPSLEGPPRKRPRSELSSEERKEARAHRNRIAAQNSRDRRKAHYSYLEQRIAQLEEENRCLRAGRGELPAPAHRSAEDERERDRAREQENEELRERIKTLENGWNAVVKALAAQGLPTGIPAPAASSLPAPLLSNTTTPHPILVPDSTTIFPISPAPSNASSFEIDAVKSEPTCHLAAGGLATDQHKLFIELPSSSHTDNHQQEPETVSDAAMEDLFREILATSPTISTSSLPLDSLTSSATQFQVPSAPSTSTAAAEMITTTESKVDWESEAEMQRLLDMLPDVQSSFLDGHDTHIALDFDLESEWNLEGSIATMGAGIGVF